MKRQLSAILMAALVSVIVILVIALGLPALGQGTSASRSEMPRTLNVQGQGFIDIPQTLAQVQLGVETQKETAVSAQTEIAQRSTAVVQLLQKNSAVKKLSTAGIRLNPVYETHAGQQDLTGYRASNMVRFQIDPASIGGLLDQAVDAGASRIDGVTLVADDEAIAQATDEAIAQATQQAKRQAQSALGALNLRQQEVIHVQINGSNPMPMEFANQLVSSVDMKPMPTSPIIAGEQRISATVTLQVRY